ncbi:MAG: 50S ribosomal protein L3 N(5)-glutamine methyltransferase [Cycloclasticus sp.]
MTIKSQKSYTIKGLIADGAELFDKEALYYGHGTDNSTDEAAYIVLTVTNKLPLDDDAVLEEKVDVLVAKEILALFQRRIKEKTPAAYLIGEAWFAGLPFYVDKHVLVPRSPFAELLGDNFSPWVNVDKTNRILDMCTGSGCIGIACAVAFPHAAVDLVDVSEPALLVADKNIEKYQLKARVSSIKSNLFEGLASKKYDLIVSNPPYVGHDELSTLPDEFYQEPQIGLDGGVTGLDLVHKILSQASNYLNDDGVLYVEVGNTDEALQRCYPKVPFLWQEFDYGGHGIFMLTKDQLLEYKQLFQAKLS